MGIGPGDCPPFDGMHEASAAVAGGSIDAVERILARRGRARLPSRRRPAPRDGGARVSGFCIYNDVALGVARARDAGHRVLYVDLDVHHGDGTQALFWDDPQVLTFSIHESGTTLFPGIGLRRRARRARRAGDRGQRAAPAVQRRRVVAAVVADVVPALAEAFRPTFLVTQHGCDTHAYDPLAHLRLTTDAYRVATVLLDEIAHQWTRRPLAGDRRRRLRRLPGRAALVVARLAGAGAPRAAGPRPTRAGGRTWSAEAERYDQSPPPELFLDPADLVRDDPADLVAANKKTAADALATTLRLLEERA